MRDMINGIVFVRIDNRKVIDGFGEVNQFQDIGYF